MIMSIIYDKCIPFKTSYAKLPREGKHMDKKDYFKFLEKPKISYIKFL